MFTEFSEKPDATFARLRGLLYAVSGPADAGSLPREQLLRDQMTNHHVPQRVAGLLLFALGVAGCGSVTEPTPTAVTATVQAENVVAGYAVPVHLVNTTAYAWTVSPCPRAIERLGSGGWRAVRIPVCASESVSMEGGEPLVVELTVPYGSEFGVYRAVYSSWFVLPGESLVAAEEVPVYSNRFYVPAMR